MKPISRFSLHRLRNRPDADRVLDKSGRIRFDHPAALADPEFAVRGRDGKIRHLTQSQMLQAQRAKWPQGKGWAGDAGAVPIITYAPKLPADAGATADFSSYPYMRPPFAGDQGTQRNLADCYFVAPLTSFARLRPSILWTAGKQLSPSTYRTRFYRSPFFPQAQFQSALDVVSDGILPTANFDDVGDDGTIWLKVFTRHYAYARTGENTYASLDWGFAGQTMLDLGVFPTSYLTNDASLVTTLMSALANNPCVVASSKADTGNTGIVPAHVYSIEGVRPTEVDINNPWKGYGATTVSLVDFVRAFSTITIGDVVAFPVDQVFTPFVPAPVEPDYKAMIGGVRDGLQGVMARLKARLGR